MVFFITFFLPVPVTVWLVLPDVKVRDRKEIKNGLDVLLVFCRIISRRMRGGAAADRHGFLARVKKELLASAFRVAGCTE